METKHIVMGVVIVAGLIWLGYRGFGRGGDFDELDPSEVSNISAFLKSAKVSDDKHGMFMGELLESWEELPFSEKKAEAEQIEEALRGADIQFATIKLGPRTVLTVTPTGRQLHEYPTGVRPKRKENNNLPPPEVAPDASEL